MIVYVVRHAERLPGKNFTEKEALELGLSKFGKLQAKAVAKKLAKLSVQKIIASPIARARETAEIIGKSVCLPVTYDERLREFITDTGESLSMAVGRLEESLKELSRQNVNRACLVTHRVVLEALLRDKFNINEKGGDQLNPASVTTLRIEGDQIIEIISFNQTYRDWRLLLSTLFRKIGLSKYE